MAPTKSGNGDVYHNLRQNWKLAYPTKTAKARDADFQRFWAENKMERTVLLKKLEELKLLTRSRGMPILKAFANKPKLLRQQSSTQINRTNVATVDLTEDEQAVKEIPPQEDQAPDESRIEVMPAQVPAPVESSCNESVVSKRTTPAQKVKEELISELSKAIADMTAAENAELLSAEQKFELKSKRKRLAQEKSALGRLKSLQRANQKYRKKKKRLLCKLKLDNPTLNIGPEKVGRPNIEREQPGLQDAILNIISANCSADAKRQCTNLRCVKNLDDLLLELQLLGYNISRSGLYLRFLPRNCATIEGKRHVSTVPVKLLKATNTMRKDHEDAHFAAATIKYLRDLAGLFGSLSVFPLSQDDKCKICMGKTAATKQSPILMKAEFKVKLPDHDWTVAPRHKLTPSVYAGLEIVNGKVTYSGPTYIAIRSAKHDSSTAFSHAIDLDRLLGLNGFREFCKTNDQVKPIWMIFVDGGPDENPRFPKTLRFAVQHFKKHNLDALFIACHAPHQSANNPVERRMAPLSLDLAGVILPHDYYGTHLDGAGRTIDPELERQNFAKAGNVLADIWSQRVIDNYEVDAEYIDPPENGSGSSGSGSVFARSYIVDETPTYLTEEWKWKHVRQSQYLLQIVKCDNLDCCGPRRTTLNSYLGSQFLPPPVKFTKTESGLKVSGVDEHGSFLDLSSRICCNHLVKENLPFDYYCPSLHNKIQSQTCQECNTYFVTKKALQLHKSVHGQQIEESVEMEDITESTKPSENGSENCIIDNMSDWLRSPFVTD